jgi:hypothetical protein
MVVCDGQDVRRVSFLVLSILVWWSFFIAWVIFMMRDVCVFVTLFAVLKWSWLVCLMCKGGWRYLVRRSDVLSCVSTPPILISPST